MIKFFFQGMRRIKIKMEEELAKNKYDEE